jgi:hypothetical protein
VEGIRSHDRTRRARVFVIVILIANEDGSVNLRQASGDDRDDHFYELPPTGRIRLTCRPK